MGTKGTFVVTTCRSLSSGGIALGAFALAVGAPLGGERPIPSSGELKRMSLEDLMDIEITSVSKRPENLYEAASAVQVITREDILRSGATSIPEALRLASNLQVAQLNTREWAISARGFNATFANKLLVLIDGRTVYTPLYSGVFWDAQHVLLEDVDRIEVISGPGGTLWGSNAVNGVINIVTKPAEETQGLYAAGGGGTLLRDFGEARSGGKAGQNAFYRIYGKRVDRNGLVKVDGDDTKQTSGLSQGGFRIDWHRSDADGFMVQGDMYGTDYQAPGPGETDLNGQDVLANWSHVFSPESDLQAQVYFDRTWRKAVFAPTLTFTDELRTYDFDFHHRFPLGSRQNIMWGAGYRWMQDAVGNVPFFSFLPADKDLSRFNAFAQDEIMLLSRRLKITLGTKLEHEEYSGFNLQPSGRIAWSPDSRQTLWGAVSRAVRTPSRIDVEFFAPTPPYAGPTLHYAGGPGFGSEDLLAYELGYRLQPMQRLSLSLATFYNRYGGLRSLESADTTIKSLEFRNGLDADSRGAELSGDFQAAAWWKLRGGCTYMESDIWQKSGHIDLEVPFGKWNDPAHQFSLQSMMDLPAGFELNLSGYYVSSLPDPHVQPRMNYSAGLVWRYHGLEASVYGRDLADDQDPESGSGPQREEIPRSFSGKLAWRI
jgi:iron complex outermembrane receptor protein